MDHSFSVHGIVGQGVDTILVITLTFGGIYPVHVLVNVMVTGYALKVGYEVIATPLTYLVINWLKRAEQSDAFDRHESFNPFPFAERTTWTLDRPPILAVGLVLSQFPQTIWIEDSRNLPGQTVI